MCVRKTQAALEYGLTPIVCVGERLEERESGRTEDVLAEQFDGGIAPLTPEQFAKIVIAYEPVWAIGTGKTATPQIAADAHRFIRSKVAAKFGDDAAAAMRILYGGSVKPDNVAKSDERRGDRRRAGGRGESRSEIVCGDREVLNRRQVLNLRYKGGICLRQFYHWPWKTSRAVNDIRGAKCTGCLKPAFSNRTADLS